MKRIIIMLLIACSAITTVSAQQKGKTDNTPYNVKALFYSLLKTWGSPADEVYSINRNPNTNQIESSVKITYFVANVNTGSVRQDMHAIADAFKKDEAKAYQVLHLAYPNKESFALGVYNENGEDATYLVRAMDYEEMWLMCVKNAENPRLRDAYAIKWSMNDDNSKALGAIYQITSLRPDLYTKEVVKADAFSEPRTFYSEIAEVVDDTLFVDTVPAIDDYSSDDVVTVVDEVADEIPEEYRHRSPKDFLSPAQQAQLELKSETTKMNIELIKSTYETIGAELKGMRDRYRIDMGFEQVLKQNKLLDAKYQDVIKTLKSFNFPQKELPELYKEILRFYTEQNQAIANIYKDYGSYTKNATKTQRYVNNQIEKYMKELTKLLS
ncbi:MAG: hypothetical protein J5720_00060 [Bacteroidaceae bacterium]|nr:hypothetical protein [Bacteroidaceae bacterium]